jgi:ribosomal protein S18 acetylase RimI-like enzyme
LSTVLIKSATAFEQEQVIATLALAFSADPFERWLYPDPRDYLKNYPAVIKAISAKSFETRHACYADGFAGSALWLPPGAQMDEQPIISIFEQTLSQHKLADTLATMEQMDHFHPHEPHWYLAIIGVDPARQGQGLGASLLRHKLDLCDREHAPAYLESTNPKNISLYQRHGFELLGTIQAGEAPPMYPMLRKPR